MMRKSCPRPIIAILCTLFLRAVSARICGNETGVDGIVVHSQLDADTKLEGCDTLVVNLIIGHNYTGELVINGVTNITQGLLTSPGNWWGAPGETEEGVPGLTSIVANDLLEVGSYGLSLNNATSLLSARFGKLQKVYALTIDLSTVGGSIYFPALETVTRSMSMSGNISSMNFSSLLRVGGSMNILNRPEFNYVYTYSLNLGENPPLAVNFPSLVNCSSLTLVGNISQISMPALTTVADIAGSRSYSTSDGYLEIYTQGAPLDLALPALWNVSDVNLAGTFANISFPSLHHLDDNFQLRSQIPMSFNTAPLESAKNIFLSGNLTGYNVSSLRNVNETISISNIDGSLDCNPGRQTWLQLRPQYSSFMNDQNLPGYYCYEKKSKPFPKLKVGLGIGLGVPAFLLFVFAIWRCAKDSKGNEEAKDHLPDYETEMETRRTGGGEVLPEYVPRDDHESTRRGSMVSSLSDMARPTERPPGYDASHPRGGVTAAEVDSGRRETGT